MRKKKIIIYLFCIVMLFSILSFTFFNKKENARNEIPISYIVLYSDIWNGKLKTVIQFFDSSMSLVKENEINDYGSYHSKIINNIYYFLGSRTLSSMDLENFSFDNIITVNGVVENISCYERQCYFQENLFESTIIRNLDGNQIYSTKKEIFDFVVEEEGILILQRNNNSIEVIKLLINSKDTINLNENVGNCTSLFNMNNTTKMFCENKYYDLESHEYYNNQSINEKYYRLENINDKIIRKSNNSIFIDTFVNGELLIKEVSNLSNLDSYALLSSPYNETIFVLGVKKSIYYICYFELDKNDIILTNLFDIEMKKSREFLDALKIN